jgi:hypothetical protein
MMIFKKAIPRRTFLRGLGATLALPWLDGMTPAFAAQAKAAARFSVVYVPSGVIMDKWTPATVGPNFALTPILEPLAPFQDRMLVLTGLDHKMADPFPGEGDVAPHDRAGGAYLTGAHPLREGKVDISVDQVVAREFGKHTQLSSLELNLDSGEVLGQCQMGWTCAYVHTLSWRTPTTPLPTESQPRAVFEHLFGDSNSTDPKERRARMLKQHSILDSAREAANRLMREIGASDRAKLSEYLDAVRDVERRIQTAEEQSGRELPALDRPVGIPARMDDHAKLMIDLQVLAYQSDLTRVITFMFGREQADRTYREIGIPDAHHPLTHHQNDPGKIAKVIRINTFHAQLLAYFLNRLQSTPDGEGSLLDHTMLLYGSGISDGNSHLHGNLPAVLFGGGSNPIRGGRHIRYPKDTPMSNLFVAMLDRLGMPPESFGDSTGKLDLFRSA